MFFDPKSYLFTCLLLGLWSDWNSLSSISISFNGKCPQRGVLSYLWCLILPHVLVFIISMIGSEINKGYISGQIIGGSMIGTALLFVLTLFIAFTPLITAMILNGSGVSQAGGIIATIGAKLCDESSKKHG